jgi:hypothetical protein
MAKHYLIHRYHGVFPDAIGPFDTASARNDEADRRLREEKHSDEDTMSALDIADDGTPYEVWVYSGGVLLWR